MPMYRFRSSADADLLMTDLVGEKILRAIGREPQAAGIIEAAALPAAIAALERAVAASQSTGRDSRHGDDDAEKEGTVPVSLGQRAWPMLEMMRRALAEKADIVWGV